MIGRAYLKILIKKIHTYLFIYLLTYSFIISIDFAFHSRKDHGNTTYKTLAFSSFLNKLATTLVASLTAMICVRFSLRRRFFGIRYNVKSKRVLMTSQSEPFSLLVTTVKYSVFVK